MLLILSERISRLLYNALSETSREDNLHGKLVIHEDVDEIRSRDEWGKLQFEDEERGGYYYWCEWRNNLSATSCSNCGIHNPATLDNCNICRRKFFKRRGNTSGSFIVNYLVRANHKAVPLPLLKDGPLRDYQSTSTVVSETDLFFYLYLPAKNREHGSIATCYISSLVLPITMRFGCRRHKGLSYLTDKCSPDLWRSLVMIL